MKLTFLFLLCIAGVASAASPSGRYGHSAIWTGSQMIIWGGASFDNVSQGDGWSYNPDAGTWTFINNAGAPTPRQGHVAVWTGTEMIIWGGATNTGGFVGSGARYNPILNQWSAMTNLNAPSPRTGHRAVWTGSEMVVWGGRRADLSWANDGARYNPANNTWTPMTTNGAPSARVPASMVWTGQRVIVWGGAVSSFSYTNTGDQYNPATDTWTTMTTNNAPSPRTGNGTVWTGTEMIIWGGYDGSLLAGGARYNPVANTWTTLPTAGAPGPRVSFSFVWDGNNVLLWGGGNGSTSTNGGARFTAAANAWSSMSMDSTPMVRSDHTAVWTGTEMLVFGGRNFGFTPNDLGRYYPQQDTWRFSRPTVMTLPHTSNSFNSVTLSATVSAGGTNSVAWFEWGAGTNFGSSTLVQALGNGTNSITVTQLLTGLSGGTFYYRALASNALGVSYGSNGSFSLPLFVRSTAVLPALNRGALAWADYDNDDRLDLLLTTYQSGAVFRNTGAGFTPGPSVPALSGDSRPSIAAWGDIDNDDWLDLVLAGTPDQTVASAITEIWRNNTGTFHRTATQLPGVVSGSTAWGDYNNDGRLDLALSGYREQDPNFVGQVWQNAGNGFFTIENGFSAFADGTLRWTDFDNDGDLDIATLGYSFSPAALQIWRNMGGAFIALTNLASHDGAIAWGDYDNDGRFDLVAAGHDGIHPRTRLYRNTPAGFVETPLPGVPGVSFGTVAWADFDNDGRLDLLVTGATNRLRTPIGGPIAQIWRNTGSGFENIDAALTPLTQTSAAWGDFNNDGRIDLALGGRGSGFDETAIWINNTARTNTPPAAPTGFNVSGSNGVVTFSWNAATDSQTPSSGLTYNLRVGTTPGGSDLVGAMSSSTGWRRLPEHGNAQKRLSRTIVGLPAGRAIYASVQAIDTAFAGSPFSNEKVIRFATVQTQPNGITVPGDNNGDGMISEAELQAVLANYWPTSPWLAMTNLAGLGTTNVTFALSNATSTSFTVEATTNLINWEPMGTAVPRYFFIDTNAAAMPQRSYRLRWP